MTPTEEAERMARDAILSLEREFVGCGEWGTTQRMMLSDIIIRSIPLVELLELVKASEAPIKQLNFHEKNAPQTPVWQGDSQEMLVRLGDLRKIRDVLDRLRQKGVVS